jgi:hypothetical protein
MKALPLIRLVANIQGVFKQIDNVHYHCAPEKTPALLRGWSLRSILHARKRFEASQNGLTEPVGK